jgi:hypothetical protein
MRSGAKHDRHAGREGGSEVWEVRGSTGNDGNKIRHGVPTVETASVAAGRLGER